MLNNKDYTIIIKEKFDTNLSLIWNEIVNSLDETLDPFKSYNWCKTWTEEIINENRFQKLKIIIIFHKQKPIIIFPLIKNKNIFTSLELIGGIASDYDPVILNKKYIIENCRLTIPLQQFIDKNIQYDQLILRKISTDTKAFLLNFTDLNKNKFYHVLNTHKLLINYDNKQNYNASKQRINLDTGRKIRRLKEIGNLKFEVIKNKEERIKLYNIFVKQKKERYEKSDNYNIFKDTKNYNFYKKLFCENNFEYAHVSCLKIEDTILATHFGFKNKNSFFWILPSYNFNYYKYSPGRIILEFLINQSKQDNLKFFDLTVGDEEYKKYWTNISEKIFNYKKNNTFFALLFEFILIIKNIIKKNKKLYFLLNKIRNKF